MERAGQNSGLKPRGRLHQFVPRSPCLPETRSSHPVLSSSSQHGPLLLQGQCSVMLQAGLVDPVPADFPPTLPSPVEALTPQDRRGAL